MALDDKTKEELANYLLNHCFVPADYDNTRKKYLDIANNQKYFNEIFKPLGYSLVVHTSPLKVVQLVNNHEGNQFKLKKYESIIALILRLLYIEKREGGLKDQENNVIVTVNDIEENYNKLDLPRKLDKKILDESLKTLKKFNIAFALDKLSDSSSGIMILPTVMLALPDKNIDRAYEKTAAFLNKYSDNKEDIDDVDDDAVEAYQLA